MTLKTFLEMFGLSSASRNIALPANDFDAAVERDINKINRALLPLLIIAFAAATYHACIAEAIGPVLLWSVACLASGATLGFLFGIPKTSTSVVRGQGAREPAATGNKPAPPDQAGSPGGLANTNLEEVSDWLTKIVVGLTLVHLEKIRDFVVQISANMAGTLGDKPSAAAAYSFASALIVGFFALGFLCGYLYTRIFLQGAFARSDPRLMKYKQVIERELSQAPVPDPESPQSTVPSQQQLQSAERVRQAAPANDPQAVLAPLKALAAEYERTRAAMPPSPERTRAMSRVASRMFTFGLAAAPYVRELANSASSGERLAAVVILRAKFDPEYSEWLAKRLVDDPPFIGYQAAKALLAGVRLLGGSQKTRLQDAVRDAQDKLQKQNMKDANRDELIAQILSE
jgi:hypothetical protein